jgi:hypothetical protein
MTQVSPYTDIRRFVVDRERIATMRVGAFLKTRDDFYFSPGGAAPSFGSMDEWRPAKTCLRINGVAMRRKGRRA